MKFETYCGKNISLVSCHGPIKDEIVMRSHIQTDEKSFALGKKYDSSKKKLKCLAHWSQILVITSSRELVVFYKA